MSCNTQMNGTVRQSMKQVTAIAPPPHLNARVQVMIESALKASSAQEVWNRHPSECAAIVEGYIIDPRLVRKVQSAPASIYALAAAGGDQIAEIASALLKSPKEDMRRRALDVIQRLNNPNVVPVYLDLLAATEEGDEFYETSISQLMQYQEDAIPALICALRSDDQKRAEAAVTVLGQMGGPLPAQVLLLKVSGKHCSSRLSSQIEACLNREGMRDRVVAAMFALTQHDNPTVRLRMWERVKMFAQQSRSHAWKLHNHLRTIEAAGASDPDQEVRKAALKAQAVILSRTENQRSSAY